MAIKVENYNCLAYLWWSHSGWWDVRAADGDQTVFRLLEVIGDQVADDVQAADNIQAAEGVQATGDDQVIDGDQVAYDVQATGGDQ